VIFVPTHLSNLDSVVFGFALDREGLPPVPPTARARTSSPTPSSRSSCRTSAPTASTAASAHELYKEVLKTYSTVLIERGYHSLFFPGGTRCRSGLVEEKLKLGLMGTGVEAFVHSLRRGHGQRVFFVPATINYLLTLEASTLIADYLAEVGRNRYIIEDDESTQHRAHRHPRAQAGDDHGVGGDSFGEPIDPFTNRVTADGRSVDPRGRTVDPAATSPATATLDEARDAQYTRELGEAI
jgi:glycerol-3-phosphate O-acyltransferase